MNFFIIISLLALMVIVLAVTTHIDYINQNKWCLSNLNGIIECHSTKGAVIRDAKNHCSNERCFVYPRIETDGKYCVADENNVYECHSSLYDAIPGYVKYCGEYSSGTCQIYHNGIPWRTTSLGCLEDGSLEDSCHLGPYFRN